MKKASVSEAKNTLSALLDRVRHGATVLIEDRGTPIARLEPVAAADPERGAALARLVRAGVVSPARRTAAPDVLTRRPPRLQRGASAVRTLLDERAEGR